MCFVLHRDEKDLLLSCLCCLETAAPCRVVLLHRPLRNALGQLRSVLACVPDTVVINFSVSRHLFVAAPVGVFQRYRYTRMCRHVTQAIWLRGFWYGKRTHALLADKEMDSCRCSWKP